MLDLKVKKDQKFPAVLIFGPPGAGKGTVSKMLAYAGNLYHLSTGDIFRGMSPNSPAGQLAASYSKQGLYVPDDVTIQIWHNFVEGLIATNQYKPDEQLLLLDGIPRTEEQAKAIKQYIDVRCILFLEVGDEEVLLNRLRGRAGKEGRADDNDDEVLRTRLRVYNEKTAGILQQYSEEHIVRVNADQTIPQVLRDVLVAAADHLTV